MEITDELREMAGLIIEELNSTPGADVKVEMEHSNPELEWVDTYLVLRKEGGSLRSWIKVESRTIMDNDGNYEDLAINIILSHDRCNSIDFECSIDALASHIIHRSSKLETLFFDKWKERFISRDDEVAMRNYRRERLRQKVFADKKSIQHKKTCSVCYEHTLTTTPCGHDLCLVCWEKLDKKICPCCREAIKYRHNEYDE